MGAANSKDEDVVAEDMKRKAAEELRQQMLEQELKR